jgi:carbon-monoxide dehydrogenase small subunit
MTELNEISVTVNRAVFRRRVEGRLLLSDFLRNDLGLTGTHVGCEHGVCGACTVILDGYSVRSCLTLAIQVDGAVVETVEGLGTAETLNPLQKLFQDHHALQCGFCTPGFLMACTDLLRRLELRTDAEIRDALSGNICRCTGYEHIVDAVREAVQQRGPLECAPPV